MSVRRKDITLEFVGPNGQTTTLEYRWRRFNRICVKNKIRYFLRIISLGELNMDDMRIRMETRYPTEMVHVLESFSKVRSSNYGTSAVMAKYVYCASSLGTRCKKVFQYLQQCRITEDLYALRPMSLDTYELLCEAADLNANPDPLLLNLIVHKMPKDYDLSRFSTRLLKAIQQKPKPNLLITHSKEIIYIVDLDSDFEFNEYRAPYQEYISQIKVSQAMPCIFFYLCSGSINQWSGVEVYNYFSNEVERVGLKSFNICPSTRDEFVYEYFNDTIRVHSLHTLKIVETIEPHIPTELKTSGLIQMSISPDSSLLALYSINCGIVKILDLDKRVWRTLALDPVARFYFASSSELVYFTPVNGELQMMRFDLITGTQHMCFDTADRYGRLSKLDVVISPTPQTVLCGCRYIVPGTRTYNNVQGGSKFSHESYRTSIIHGDKITKVPIPRITENLVYCISHDGKYLYSIAEYDYWKVHLMCWLITEVDGSIQLNRVADQPYRYNMQFGRKTKFIHNIQCDWIHLRRRIEKILEE